MPNLGYRNLKKGCFREKNRKYLRKEVFLDSTLTFIFDCLKVGSNVSLVSKKKGGKI